MNENQEVGQEGAKGTLPLPYLGAETEEAPATPALVAQQIVYDSLAPDKRTEILKIETAITARLTNMKFEYYEIGKLLTQAKETLPHGQYEPWLKQTFGRELGVSTAAHIKGIYKFFKGYPDAVALLPFTFLQHVSRASFPDAVREIIQANPQAIAEADTKNLELACKELKENKINLDQFMAMTKEQVRIGTDILKGESRVRHSDRARRVSKLGYGSLQTQVSLLCKRIIAMQELHPPAVNGQPALADICEQALIADLDACIAELGRFKATIIKGHAEQCKVLKPRLTAEKGYVEQMWA
jgi:hypothetical protein